MLSDGTYAILFINDDEHERDMSFISQDIGMTEASGYKLHMRDILSDAEYVQNDFINATVPGRDCRIFRCKLVK